MRATKRRRTSLASFCPVIAVAAICPLASAQLQVQPSIALTILPAANITVYQTTGTSAYTAPSVAPTLGSSPVATNESAAGDSPILVPPNPPAGLPSTVSVDLTTTPANLSVVIKAPFAGLSIELSIVQQLIGKSGSLLQVPFLNYIQSRLLPLVA